MSRPAVVSHHAVLTTLRRALTHWRPPPNRSRADLATSDGNPLRVFCAAELAS